MTEAPVLQQITSLFLRLDPDWDEICRTTLADLLQANQQGHVCLPVYTEGVRRRLAASPLVGRPGSYAPLILDAERNLYFAQHWCDETRVASGLLRLARGGFDYAPDGVYSWLVRLFPDNGGPKPDRQKLAAALAVRQQLLVISGGPGTGKTTTVIRLLALLAVLSERPLVMALAAPTGKAAARLSDAIRQASQFLPLNPQQREQLPQHAQTLHRLLGLRRDGNAPRFHAGNPLPLDVLVVDEASMIDLSMMAQTLDALPPHARLILLGDRDQLASVEAGAVLGEICQRVDYREATRAWLLASGCDPIDSADPNAPPRAENLLADCIALLTHSHRFSADSGIGMLSRLINSGQSDAALEVLHSENRPDLGWRAQMDGDFLALQWAEYLRLACSSGQPEAVRQQFVAFMPLVSERRQVDELNRMVEARLERDGRKPVGQMWYAGRPVMISTNDYGLDLFNGDIGFTLARPDGLRVAFPCPDGGWREIAPGRLPAHDTVYAMTVHKSQGSEFEEVWLVLPQTTSAMLDRALVYTAVTRARSRFGVCGGLDVLRAAIGNAPERHSGLALRLQST